MNQRLDVGRRSACVGVQPQVRPAAHRALLLDLGGGVDPPAVWCKGVRGGARGEEVCKGLQGAGQANTSSHRRRRLAEAGLLAAWPPSLTARARPPRLQGGRERGAAYVNG